MPKPKSSSAGMRGLELEVAEVSFYPSKYETNVITQQTDRSTAVTINAVVGQITTNNTSLAAGAEAKFVVNNTKVTAKSVIVINAASGQTADTSVPVVVAVAANAFTIQLTNLNASTADTGAMVINFIVLGGN